MKRRQVLATLTSAVSAIVFTGSGWLMGTKTLTMPGPTPQPPSQTPPPVNNDCGDGELCTFPCGRFYTCINWTTCCTDQSHCEYVLWDKKKCETGTCPNCMTGQNQGDCGCPPGPWCVCP